MAALKGNGFTLLELLVVLAIASLMIAVIPPLISGFGSAAELRGAARQLAAGFRSARSQAVSTQRDVLLTVDLEQRRFRVSSSERSYPLPEAAEIKLYTAQSELMDEAMGSIRFFPDGSSTGGHVSLVEAQLEYRVNVDWLTGRVNISQSRVAP